MPFATLPPATYMKLLSEQDRALLKRMSWRRCMALAARHVNATLRAQAGLMPHKPGAQGTDGWRRALVLFTAAHHKAPRNPAPLVERARVFARVAHWYVYAVT